MDKIRESIIDIVKRRLNYCDYNCVDITDDTDIVSDLGLDSIDVMIIHLDIECEFNITLDKEFANGVSTIGEITRVVRDKFYK